METSKAGVHLNGEVALCVPTCQRFNNWIIQWAAQTVLGVYLKPTCSRVTSASSALGVLNALYKSTHARMHSLPRSAEFLRTRLQGV